MSESQTEHPTAVELEAFRGGEADQDLQDHLEHCVDCRAELKFLRALGQELGQPTVPLAVPEQLEQQILAMAHKRAGQVREHQTQASQARRWRRLFAWAGPAAAAAVLLIVVSVPMVTLREESTPAAGPVEARADYNRDGRVDVVDALLLAKAVQAQEPLDKRWDLNGDSSVDADDAEHIALAAVNLSGAQP